MNVLRGHSVSHDCGSTPTAASPALSVPIVGVGRSYMNFQITPAATKLIAHRDEDERLGTPLAADPVARGSAIEQADRDA